MLDSEVMHKNAIKSVFEAFLSQKIADKGYKFSDIFELSLNLRAARAIPTLSKSPNLKLCNQVPSLSLSR